MRKAKDSIPIRISKENYDKLCKVRDKSGSSISFMANKIIESKTVDEIIKLLLQ